jgi:hypothetical protein
MFLVFNNVCAFFNFRVKNPIIRRIAETPEDDLLVNASDVMEDNSDLSLLIDDILSKKVHELSFQKPVRAEKKLRTLQQQVNRIAKDIQLVLG